MGDVCRTDTYACSGCWYAIDKSEILEEYEKVEIE